MRVRDRNPACPYPVGHLCELLEFCYPLKIHHFLQTGPLVRSIRFSEMPMKESRYFLILLGEIYIPGFFSLQCWGLKLFHCEDLCKLPRQLVPLLFLVHRAKHCKKAFSCEHFYVINQGGYIYAPPERSG